jgi:hypothetical protein
MARALHIDKSPVSNPSAKIRSAGNVEVGGGVKVAVADGSGVDV